MGHWKSSPLMICFPWVSYLHVRSAASCPRAASGSPATTTTLAGGGQLARRRCLINVRYPSYKVKLQQVGVFDVRATAPGLTSIRAGTRPVTSYRMRTQQRWNHSITDAPHLELRL